MVHKKSGWYTANVSYGIQQLLVYVCYDIQQLLYLCLYVSLMVRDLPLMMNAEYSCQLVGLIPELCCQR